MAIEVTCQCGRKLRARDELAGKKAKCPGCGKVLTITRPTEPDDLYSFAPEIVAPRRPQYKETPQPILKAAAPAAASAGTMPRSVAVPSKFGTPVVLNPALTPDKNPAGARRYLHVVLVLALLPLIVSSLHPKLDVLDRLKQTVRAHPEVADQVESQLQSDDPIEGLMTVLPDHRIEGALLARDSKVHWLFAGASAGLFFMLCVLLFPRSAESPGKMALVGVFTATIGIVFLLGVQYLAEWTDGRIMYGRGILVLVFYIAKFIGFSYRAGVDPDTNLFISFFGFTFGVGLCEELVKAMPVLFRVKAGSSDYSWRTACMMGLISGVGFGVSEGITYTGDYYNGISGMEAYMVRFISCVALHAVWSGAAAIFIYKHQDMLNGAESIWAVLGASVVLVVIPMCLHGAYDTLLKKDHEIGALIAAIASFAWFAIQVETARRQYGEGEVVLV